MWIESTREAHAGNEFKDRRVGELNDGAAVSFNDTGTAQVTAEVGDYLTDAYDVFTSTDAPDETDPDDEEPSEDTADVAADDDDEPTDVL